MKRELLCEDCGVKARRMFPTDEPYPGEFVRLMSGTLKRGKSGYVCDDCGHPFMAGERAVCMGIWMHHSAEAAMGWVDEYLDGAEEIPALAKNRA